MSDTEIEYLRFSLALACRQQELCKLEQTYLDKQIKSFSRRYEILIRNRDYEMPRKNRKLGQTHDNAETYTKQTKLSKQETKQAIIRELAKKNIVKYEDVLGYICFKYNGREYRVNKAFDTRQILGL